MSKKKDYIKLVYNEYGYEIYVISDGKKYRLSKQNKMIMHKVLKKFKCIEKGEDTYIFPNYKLIVLYFTKEKLKKKFKKVNRGASRRIIAGVLAGVTLISVINIINNRKGNNGVIDNGESSSIVYEMKEDEIYDLDEKNIIMDEDEGIYNIYYDDSVDTDQLADDSQEYIEYDEEVFNEEEETLNNFKYVYETPRDKGALTNSEQYMEIFSKYERMYGVDAKLLCAIGAQESSGVHHSESINGGYATGLMGIENIWADEEIRVFNFDTNSYETIVVDYSRIGELDYNIKIGAAIFQNYFYSTLRNNTSISDDEFLAFVLQKYNMGPGNMRTVLSYGGDWIGNRQMIVDGDSNYFENVLSRLDNDTIIKIRLDDGSYYETRIINTALDYHHNRV